MATSFELLAEPRHDLGTGASRRLRRQGQVPVILYGGDKPPEPLAVEHRIVLRQLEEEAFYSHVLTVKIGERVEQAILRDLQRHPFKPVILHMDLQRIQAEEKIRVHVPLHFLNEATCTGVKDQGGMISRLRNEVEIACLPKDLPEFVEVDLQPLKVGDSLYLSDVQLPPGLEIVELAQGAEYDAVIVNIQGQRTAAAEGEESAPDAES